VSLRNVTAGVTGVDNVEIAKGLSIGEEVVTEGGDRLKDGARIQTSSDRAAAASATAPGPPAQANANGARSGRGQFGGHRGARSEGVAQAPANGNAPTADAATPK
jgi:multidrug efflux system membrane fusion protein